MTSDVLNSGKASVQYDASKGYVIALSVKDYDEFYKQTKKVSEMENNQIVSWLDYEDGTKLEMEQLGYGYYETVEVIDEEEIKEAQEEEAEEVAEEDKAE